MPEGSATAIGVGVGLWVILGWSWIGVQRGRRLQVMALYGLVCATALGVGVLWPWWVGNGGASSLAAIGGATVALAVFVRPWHKETRWMMDHLVPGGIAGLSVARVGCVFDGCDFGRITESAPSVIHEVNTRAWEVHVVEYGLSIDSTQSLPVHPFALYLAAWGVLAAAFGEWMRRRRHGAGAAAMASAAVFFAGGGFIEWLREPVTVPALAEGVPVYPLLYWIGAAVAAAIGWKFRSRGVERDE